MGATQRRRPWMSYPSQPHNEHDDAVERAAAVLEEMLEEANPGASKFADEFIANAGEKLVEFVTQDAIIRCLKAVTGVQQ